MKIVKNIQKLSHEIVVYAKDGRKSHLTLHWSAENVKIDKTNFSLRNTIPIHGINKTNDERCYTAAVWTQISIPPVSSARSTKRWVSGMLMSVGVESSHWQIAKRLRSWASSEARPCQQSCRDGLRMSALQMEEGQISPSIQSSRRRSLHVPFRTAPIR